MMNFILDCMLIAAKASVGAGIIFILSIVLLLLLGLAFGCINKTIRDIRERND